MVVVTSTAAWQKLFSPDLRLGFLSHANDLAAKLQAGTLGGGMLFLAVAIGLGAFDTAVRALAGVAFLLFTTPIASHLIGRATYLLGVPRDPRQERDDLEGRYDLIARTCQAPPDVLRASSMAASGGDSPSAGTGGGAA